MIPYCKHCGEIRPAEVHTCTPLPFPITEAMVHASARALCTHTTDQDYDTTDAQPQHEFQAQALRTIRAAFAHLPRVVVTEEWRMIDKIGRAPFNDSHRSFNAAQRFARYNDQQWPTNAPHTVKRVALMEDE